MNVLFLSFVFITVYYTISFFQLQKKAGPPYTTYKIFISFSFSPICCLKNISPSSLKSFL